MLWIQSLIPFMSTQIHASSRASRIYTMTNQKNEFQVRSGELFAKNLMAFKQYNADIYKLLKEHKPKSKLVFDTVGNPDIDLDGKRIFDGRAKETSEEQIKAFLDYPTHIALSAPEPGMLDRYGNPLLKNILDRAKADNISFTKGLPDGDSLFFVMFGVGLGFHIDTLIEKMSPAIINIVEPNFECLYHSLGVYAWHRLLKRQADLGGFVIFTINDNPEIISLTIQQIMHHFCPAGVDGTPFFAYADKGTADKTIKSISQNLGSILTGLGFLFDECLMLKNTYLNLNNESSTFFHRTRVGNLDTPVFVVGAGPSLDADIEFIRAHADKVIIVSTGSGIRSLLVNGITPDFHIEMENIHVYSSINELSQSFDLSSICLVVPTSIEHHIIKFFDNILYYYRDSTPAFPLFGFAEDNALTTPGPLVVNASFSFALDLGGKDVYLFGTDFGSRGDGLDHAKDNVLFTDTAIVGYVREYGHPVAANFEGQFFASNDFVWGLKVMRETILRFGHGRRIFNCSDGALVQGATPVRSSDLELQVSQKRKKRDLKKIQERQSVLTADNFGKFWNKEKILAEINKISDDLLTHLGQPESFLGNGFLIKYMQIAMRTKMSGQKSHYTSKDQIPTAIAVIFRGTLDSILTSVRYYLTRLRNPEDAAKFRKILAEEMTMTIQNMRADAIATIDNPTQILPEKAGGTWDENDFIQEAYYTWGDTPRNSLCPCGSGKRYKHCHGKSN